MIKVNASQFFKNACINRGIERIEALLDRVPKSTGYSSVAIMRGQRMSGCLCTPNKRHSHSHQTISFHEIKSCLKFAQHDIFFRVGDKIVCRKRGWPMGGALGEPSTLVDLQESIRLLCDKSASANDLDCVLPGLSKHNLKFDRIVQGLQHVDDAGAFF